MSKKITKKVRQDIEQAAAEYQEKCMELWDKMVLDLAKKHNLPEEDVEALFGELT